MDVWIYNCPGAEGEVFSDFLNDVGYDTVIFNDPDDLKPFGDSVGRPDVMIVGISAMTDRGLDRLIQISRLEKVTDSFPGIPLIIIAPDGFPVPLECGATDAIHSFVCRPVPLEELEMELRHLDT